MKENTYNYEFIKKNNLMDICLFFSIDCGGAFNKHFHDWIEIIYIVRGELEFFDNNRAINLKENDLMVVNSMSIHSTRCLRGNTAILLQIPVDFIKKYMPDIQQYRFNVMMKDNTSDVRTAANRLKSIIQEMFMSYELKEHGYIFQCYSLLFEMLRILVTTFSDKLDSSVQIKSERNMRRMKEIMDYINLHYMEELPLGNVAEMAGLNSVYFSRFFKEQVGITYLEYLNTVRIEHIYQDLLNTDWLIKEIQERHGFYNHKLFMRMFKKAYGCTPSELRKS